MLNPDFSQCPGWVRWVAQDADGTWWGFEHEPHLADTSWYENEVGRQLKLGSSRSNAAWKESLKKL
ncbi:MAG: hypothetical protein WBN96_04800 [Gammaproteobacteria bacterium]